MTQLAECIKVFRTRDEWRAWARQSPWAFSADYARAFLDGVRSRGLRDPIHGHAFAAGEVRIAGENYRESLKAGRLISRHRALLMVYRLIADCARRPALLTPKARIFAPEALTGFALYLRAHFARFLGSEYAQTPAERAALFPIPAEDLHGLSFHDGAFDVLMSNDVFEHVHDLDRVLRESARVLNAQGILLATFPFAFQDDASVRKARLTDAGIEHLVAPEYHGNPMRPQEGSLVFEIPGWDMVARAKAAGFCDACFVFVSSPRHGVLGAGLNGVFVFLACKAEGIAPAQPAAGPARALPKTLAGLVGLPRSGTTVLTAALAAHSQVSAIYEPWNAGRKTQPPTNLDLPGFLAEFAVPESGRPVLLVKETATALRYLDGIENLLARSVGSAEARLIWIWRDPLHVLLSEIQARREWWGEPGLELNVDTFERWAERSAAALRRILAMTKGVESLCLPYETLVREPEKLLGRCMRFLGMEFEPAQTEFFRTLDGKEVRGDIRVAREPEALSPASTARRELEWFQCAALVESAPSYPLFKAISAAGQAYAQRYFRAGAAETFLTVLGGLLEHSAAGVPEGASPDRAADPVVGAGA